MEGGELLGKKADGESEKSCRDTWQVLDESSMEMVGTLEVVVIIGSVNKSNNSEEVVGEIWTINAVSWW